GNRPGGAPRVRDSAKRVGRRADASGGTAARTVTALHARPVKRGRDVRLAFLVTGLVVAVMLALAVSPAVGRTSGGPAFGLRGGRPAGAPRVRDSAKRVGRRADASGGTAARTVTALHARPVKRGRDVRLAFLVTGLVVAVMLALAVSLAVGRTSGGPAFGLGG